MGNLFLPVRRTIKQIDSKLSGVNQVCKRIISEDDNEQKRKFESENKIDIRLTETFYHKQSLD